MLLIKVRKTCFQIEKYLYTLSKFVNLCLYCCVWCWSSTRECQFSDSRTTKIANFLPPPIHGENRSGDFPAEVFWHFIKSKMSFMTKVPYKQLTLNICENTWIYINIHWIYVAPWCSGYDYCTTLFNKAWLCTGSNPAWGMSEIRDGEDHWQWSQLEIKLYAFRGSSIP